jgi:hypothetical protein
VGTWVAPRESRNLFVLSPPLSRFHLALTFCWPSRSSPPRERLRSASGNGLKQFLPGALCRIHEDDDNHNSPSWPPNKTQDNVFSFMSLSSFRINYRRVLSAGTCVLNAGTCDPAIGRWGESQARRRDRRFETVKGLVSKTRYRYGAASYLEILTNETKYFDAESGLTLGQLKELLAIARSGSHLQTLRWSPARTMEQCPMSTPKILRPTNSTKHLRSRRRGRICIEGQLILPTVYCPILHLQSPSAEK